jgi:F0F1-type ATP synthase assembly protein I
MSGMDQGMRVLSYLIAGVLVYGGLGWWGDHYFGTGFLLPIGIVLGAAGGCYVIIRRYGQVPEALSTVEGPGQPGSDDAVTNDPSTTDSTTNQKREGAR